MSYIVGLGGVRATGKSTLARNLGLILRADIISAGRTREMIRAQYKKEDFPDFFVSVTGASSLEEALRYLKIQSEIIKPSIKAVIRQCREREANLIIEGTHVYPGFYKKEDLDLEIFLVAPKEKIEYRIHKDKKRRISKNTIERNLELQEYLKNEAKKHHVPVVDTTSLPKALIEIVRLLPEGKEPVTFFE